MEYIYENLQMHACMALRQYVINKENNSCLFEFELSALDLVPYSKSVWAITPKPYGIY